MFIHNLKYSLKTLLKNKMLIFWTFAFPIILGTFFKLAFSNIENSEKLDIIDIAIVDNQELEDNQIYKQAFNKLSEEESENRLFNTKYVSKEEAKQLLQDDKIVGYFILENDPKVIVSNSGIDETIFKCVTDEITQTTDVVIDVAKDNIQKEIMNGNYNIDYEKIYRSVAELYQNQEVNIKDISNSNLSYTMIEYYTLIAMACLYGGILGMVAINYNLPNMSSNGKRIAVSPTSKGKIILSSVIASYITQLIGIAILFLFTVFILKVDYGTNLPLVILLAIVGCLAGLSIGVASASLLKTNDNVKTGVIISFTMVGCFLSGMMGITMKYIVDKNIPILNKLNPANMITDGFYSLYYYDTLDRYYFNIISLLIFSIVLIGLSILSLRRQRYDSI
ncbi:MAG: ABC transporter permease [Clostridia bacterium]